MDLVVLHYMRFYGMAGFNFEFSLFNTVLKETGGKFKTLDNK
jgi:hypothetical protein